MRKLSTNKYIICRLLSPTIINALWFFVFLVASNKD